MVRAARLGGLTAGARGGASIATCIASRCGPNAHLVLVMLLGRAAGRAHAFFTGCGEDLNVAAAKGGAILGAVRTTRFLGSGEGDESLTRQAAIRLEDKLNALGTQAETCRTSMKGRGQ